MSSAPNPEKVRRALERIPLVISFSPFLDESARLAHLVLPDHTYLERWQDAPAPSSLPYPVWGIVRPVVDPLHDTRSTGDVVLELAARLGGDVREACPWSSMEALVRDRGRVLAAADRGSAFVTEFRADIMDMVEPGVLTVHVPISRPTLADAFIGMTRVSPGRGTLQFGIEDVVRFSWVSGVVEYELLEDGGYRRRDPNPDGSVQ